VFVVESFDGEIRRQHTRIPDLQAIIVNADLDCTCLSIVAVANRIDDCFTYGSLRILRDRFPFSTPGNVNTLLGITSDKRKSYIRLGQEITVQCLLV
jgi:hypothetical protein